MRSLTILAAALALTAALIQADARADDSPGGEGRRNLRRRVDHIVLTGEALPKLLARNISELRLMSMRAGKLVVVPFQIDERTPAGGYAYDKGGDTKKDPDGGRFDANDELVFMVRDTGDRAPKEVLAELETLQEIEVTDPKDKALAWTYLVHFKKDAPPLSTVDYVRITYDSEGKLGYFGDGFVTGNERSLGNAVRTSSVRFVQKDKSLSENVFDTTKTRAKIHYFAVAIARNGTEMRVKIGAWIDGPIRVVALNVVEIYLIWGFWVSAPDSLIYFYDYGSVMPSNVNIPVNIDEADPPSIARLSSDLSSRASGWFFYNSYNKTPVAIDGVMSPQEKALDMRFPEWNVMYGPDGGIITRFKFEDTELTSRKYSRLYYQDDAKANDAPENEAGCYGNCGFELDLSGMKTRIYKGSYFSYYRKGFRYGDEARFIDIVDHPLEVKAR